MSSIIQFLVDEGVFEEDPDGVLWLSDKMKKVITKLEKDEKFLEELKAIKDDHERALKRWVILYLNFMGEATEEELVKAVSSLAAWELAATEQNLTEWSMKLRIL